MSLVLAGELDRTARHPLLVAILSVISWAIIASSGASCDARSRIARLSSRSITTAPSTPPIEAARDLDRSPLVEHLPVRLRRAEPHGAFLGHESLTELAPGHVRALTRHIRWSGSGRSCASSAGSPFLATTGSAAPFIGLFGTVIGIINAFQSIGRCPARRASRWWRPGIAEALIATAIGLFAAIPATIFYNYFLGDLRSI